MEKRIRELLDADRFDAEAIMEKYIEEWTTDEYRWFFQQLDSDENNENISTAASCAINWIEDEKFIKEVALSGKYGTSIVKMALLNSKCPNEVAEKFYHEPKPSTIWGGIIEENLKKWGKDYFDNISVQINTLIEKEFKSLDFILIKSKKL